MAMALISKGYKKVYLLDMQENILPASLDKDMASLVESEMKKRGIELIMGANIKSIHRSPEGKCLALDDHEIAVPYVILSAGSHPNIELARKAGITIGKTGGILVNQYLQSNDPDIYAAGDCIENYDRIIGQKHEDLW